MNEQGQGLQAFLGRCFLGHRFLGRRFLDTRNN